MQIFIDRNGFKTEVTKNQLFALAADGSIGPETKLYLDGKEVLAGRVKGLTFKNREDDIYNIPDDPPAGVTPFPNQVPANSVPQSRPQAGDFQKFFQEKKPRKFSVLRVVIIAICLFAMVGAACFYSSNISKQKKELNKQEEALKLDALRYKSIIKINQALEDIAINTVSRLTKDIEEDIKKKTDQASFSDFNRSLLSKFSTSESRAEDNKIIEKGKNNESKIEADPILVEQKKEAEKEVANTQKELKEAKDNLALSEAKIKSHKESYSKIYTSGSSVASIAIFLISLLSFVGQFFVKSL